MWNLIIGGVFIIGGISGTLALKGTGSSGALAGVGVILVIWGIVQLNAQRKPTPTRRSTVRKFAKRGGRPGTRNFRRP
jgi:predicted phage tail protein